MRSRIWKISIGVWAALCLLLALPLKGQLATGTILGHVQDPSGAVIPGATVTLLNVDTGVTGTFTTTTSGDYVFVNLIPGTYEVTCEAKGFKRGVSAHLVVQVDHTLRQDFALELGAITQQITVSGATQMVQTDNASLGGVVTDSLMAALPLNGRDFTSLMALDAGVTQPSGGIQTSVFAQHGLDDTFRMVSINGVRPSDVSYLLDGFSNNDLFFNKATVVPSEYSIQEFKVQSGLYSAEYGSGSAQINAAVKSGTNSLHGNAYDFLRNAAFAPKNELNFQQNALHGTNLPTSDPLKQQNQFGGTLGGPIKRDRAFFFGSYEGGRRRSAGSATTMMLPTVAERGGNFSDWPYPIYDPSTTVVTSSSPLTISRTQFPGNIITTALNPVAQKLLAYLPPPNVNCTMPCTNFVGANPGTPINTSTVTGRMDYRLRDRDQLAYTMVIWRDNNPTPSIIPINGTTVYTRSQLYGLDWQHSFGPSAVNDLRVGYNRMFYHNGVLSAFGSDVAKALGLANTPTVAAFFNLPAVNPTQGYAGLGNTNNGYTQTDNDFQYLDTLKFTRGKHSFTFGADIRRVRMFNIDGFTAEGKFDLTGEYTGINPVASRNGQTGPTAGNSIADLLLGDPTDVWAPLPIASDIYDLRGTAYGFYAQDNFRVTPRLTVNLGLRWEIPPGLHSTNNSGVTADLNVPGGGLIWANQKFATQMSAGLTPAQVATYMVCCTSNQLVPRQLDNFAPRIGFALRPLHTDRLVVRGGYGIFYDVWNRFYDGTDYDDNSLRSVSPPAYPSGTGYESVSPVAMSGLWLPPITVNPYQTLLQTPWNYTTYATTYLGNRTPYNEQWALDTQYALNQNLMLDVGYVGSHSVHIPGAYHFDEAYPPPVAGDACNYLLDASLATGTNAACLSDPNFVPIDKREPYPNLAPNRYATMANIFSGYYNALQVRFSQRYWHGLQFMANYTHSHTVDMLSELARLTDGMNLVQNAYNLPADYGSAEFDQSQRFVVSESYAVPIGKGKRWSLGPANWILGGWNTGGILTFASGLPETVFCCPRIQDQFGNLYAERLRANVSGSPTAGITQTPLMWINPSVFSTPTPGTFGNSVRGLVRVGGQRQGDIAFTKQTPITERHKLEYRLEIFNVLSSTHTGQHFFGNYIYSSPANCTPGPSGNCAFGSTVSLNGSGALNYWNPRILQMALVYSF